MYILQLVEQYLRQYEIPSTVKICSLGWRDLFSEFVDRLAIYFLFHHFVGLSRHTYMYTCM